MISFVSLLSYSTREYNKMKKVFVKLGVTWISFLYSLLLLKAVWSSGKKNVDSHIAEYISQFCLLAVEKVNLMLLCFHLLFCKMGMIIVPTWQRCEDIHVFIFVKCLEKLLAYIKHSVSIMFILIRYKRVKTPQINTTLFSWNTITQRLMDRCLLPISHIKSKAIGTGLWL